VGVTGLGTGFLAALVGVGGAELRIPALLYLLRGALLIIIAVNLLISLLTSGASFLLRLQAGLFPWTLVGLVGAMILGSLPGAYVGAILAHGLPERRLRQFLAAVLVFVISRLLLEPVLGTEAGAPVLPFPWDFVAAVTFGALVGVVSGMAGVAGGEYRIPVLMFVFGLPIKLAGSASQLVALPTIVTALVRHRRQTHFGPNELRLTLGMGLSSVAGVVLGTVVLAGSGDVVVRVAFIGILAYAVFGLLRHPESR
jgi:uncharacterized membrane protein YfcA